MGSKLKTQSQALDDLWAQGLSGMSLLRNHSDLADQFIRDCLASIDGSGIEGNVALVALGGYGRQELFPFSDIDLMILFRPEFRKKVSDLADAILYPLWDTGYEIGHGVRTIDESLKQAKEDFVFRVALLDARLLGGSEDLFNDLMRVYRLDFVEGRRHDFISNLNTFDIERRDRFGSHGYLLEPNIKESKGGFRDIQSMIWAAKVVFGINSFAEIVDAGFLLPSEGERFDDAHNMLVRIRNRLHYISSRKNDQLYFEQQEDMASAFGYKDSGKGLSVESFMRDVYGHLRTITVVHDLFFDHVNEVLGLTEKQPQISDRELESGLEVRSNRVHLRARPEDLAAKPYLLMRAFLASAKTGAAVHHRSKMAITDNLGLINAKMRSSPRMAKPFHAILALSESVFPVLEGMLETGLLGMYIPEFARIDALAQHDVYHIFTVDHHLLQTVLELHKVVAEEQEVASLINRRRPFHLAALLHDIGKKSGRDHSEYGAELSETVGERLCLDKDEIDILSFLIRYHLFIPENALRRDLEDRAFIKRCAETIGDVERLAMLYLLSMADSRATGPLAWSEWKALLMRDMYLKIKSYLEAVAEESDVPAMVDRHYEDGVVWLREQVATLAEKEPGLKMSVAELSADYLSSFTPQTILSHLRYHRDYYQIVRQKSLVFAEESSDHWSVLVMSNDQPGLLAKICGVMTLNQLTVVNAQIFTWPDGTVVDMIDVKPAEQFGFEECDWKAVNEDLDRAVSHRLGLGYRLYEKLKSSYGRKRELIGSLEYRVDVDNSGSNDFTIIEVHAGDIPGQLYRITQTLADFGINIHKAFIATEVGQLIDVFYVLDKKGNKVDDDGFLKEIVNGLMHAIGADESGDK
jgi:[protein-PII] uridylyltransferase